MCNQKSHVEMGFAGFRDAPYGYRSLSFMVGWLCLTSHRRGHLETAPPFTVPCEGREARKKTYLKNTTLTLNRFIKSM